MTHVRMTTFQGEPGVHEEAALFVREDALPAIRKLRGFQGMRLMVNRQTGKVIVVTLWDSLGAAEAAGAALSRPRAHGAQSVGAFDPVSEIFELTHEENA